MRLAGVRAANRVVSDRLGHPRRKVIPEERRGRRHVVRCCQRKSGPQRLGFATASPARPGVLQARFRQIARTFDVVDEFGRVQVIHGWVRRNLRKFASA
jgi:hypothetical protein